MAQAAMAFTSMRVYSKENTLHQNTHEHLPEKCALSLEGDCEGSAEHGRTQERRRTAQLRWSMGQWSGVKKGRVRRRVRLDISDGTNNRTIKEVYRTYERYTQDK